MTDEEAKLLFEEFRKYYNGKIVSPDHYPKIFEHQLKLFKYYKRLNNESSNSTGSRN